MKQEPSQTRRSKFPPLYWLAVLFEFFERGSYYGVMSVLSVYLTDQLHFAKQGVGLIKGTIQPIVYFLPIVSGALADRFGYRRTLMAAFALLSGGYLLTSQSTQYSTVFLSLVVMGLGAGTFKPVIAGTIARCTDPSNSALGFGVFYWTINLGAFVVPLFLVPYLKNTWGWDWVIRASAIGTGAMLIPALLLFRDPPAPKEDGSTRKAGLLQTLANAFEIIYSPFVLLHAFARRARAGVALLAVLFVVLLGYGGLAFVRPKEVVSHVSAPAYRFGPVSLELRCQRNLGERSPYVIKPDLAHARVTLVLHDPDRFPTYAGQLVDDLRRVQGLSGVDRPLLQRFLPDLERKVILELSRSGDRARPFEVVEVAPQRYEVRLGRSVASEEDLAGPLAVLRSKPGLEGLAESELQGLVKKTEERPFLLLFVALLLGASLVIFRLERVFKSTSVKGRALIILATLGVLWGVLSLMPHLSLFARLLSGVIAATLVSLYAIDYQDVSRFRDHARFLLMICIYSGFWVLYFQMFDSVLWYVQAYVDASSVDRGVNAFLSFLHVRARFRFDVEHVTVINAGTIILLQLLISSLVKNTRALPTMIVGIGFGTIGMGILAISTGIWVFILGITIFSIGEMTAHPKFISYVGQTAPKARVALYMGYLFLYGVIGSSIGGVVGANLYVKFVDQLNRPRTLWLIFAAIGAATVVGLLLFDRLASKERNAEKGAS
jgi:dipeptide/tripeptide permease